MLDLLDQIQSFFLTFLMGVVLGAIIHYYQLTIRKGHLRKYLLYALDFFIWIILMAVIFTCLVMINLGEMRAYVFVALLGGVLVYYRYAARYCGKILSYGAQATVTFFSLAKGYTSIPIGWGMKQINLFFNKMNTNAKPPDLE